jgi:hypothetical protein
VSILISLSLFAKRSWGITYFSIFSEKGWGILCDLIYQHQKCACRQT